MSPETFADEYRVSRETLTRLLAYQALLGRWQQRINLVGPATLEDFGTAMRRTRHSFWPLPKIDGFG